MGRLVVVRDENLRTSRSPGGGSARLELLASVAAMDIPFVRREIARRPVVFINDPELIAEVLVTRADSFEKSEFQRRVMGMAEGSATGLGNGLLTSANATNRAQRKLLGRSFSPLATRDHVAQVAALARDERERWADGAHIELGDAFMRLSARIVARTLFSWDLAAGDERIAADLARIGSLLGRPAAERRAGWEDPSVIEGAAAHIEERLLSLVADRRQRRAASTAPASGDVIDVLLDAGVDDRQIRDDLMTLFITGAENPRNALTWALYLIARHPETARRVRAEIDAAGAGSGDVTPETLQRLPFTLQVFKETLRLYPPGYAFGRRAIEDVRIGLFELAKDTEIVISPYALHRRPTLFERPAEFDPDRFAPEREAERHPCAYLPFGAGPRSCIGGGFALMTGHVVLAVLLGGLQCALATDDAVLPEPRMTLRPDRPVPVIVHRDPARA